MAQRWRPPVRALHDGCSAYVPSPNCAYGATGHSTAHSKAARLMFATCGRTCVTWHWNMSLCFNDVLIQQSHEKPDACVFHGLHAADGSTLQPSRLQARGDGCTAIFSRLKSASTARGDHSAIAALTAD